MLNAQIQDTGGTAHASQEKAVTTYLTEEEYEEVRSGAERTALTISTYVRRVSRGLHVKSLEPQMCRLEIRRLHGDLGRIVQTMPDGEQGGGS